MLGRLRGAEGLGEGTGDSGIVITAEARYLVPGIKPLGADLTLATFFDAGASTVVKSPLPADNPNKRSASGAGFGATLGKEGDFVMRAGAAWRTDGHPPVADTAKRFPRIWVEAIMRRRDGRDSEAASKIERLAHRRYFYS